MVTILLIPISSPLLIGIYKNEELIEEIELNGMTSDLLPLEFKKLLKKHDIEKIIYVNGPGSYMAIKVAYIFLKTLCITKSIQFQSISGFELNNNSPIKALGKKYFKIDENKDIIIQNLNGDEKILDFKLPKSIEKLNLSSDILPNYVLPAIN